MSDEKTIESLCDRIACGNRTIFRTLIAELSGARVFVPATSVSSDGSVGTLSKVRVVTFPRKGQSSLVPAFSSEGKFNIWTQNRYERIDLFGSDLALSLPTGCSIILNPGEASAITIENEDVLLMASLDSNAELDAERGAPASEAVSPVKADEEVAIDPSPPELVAVRTTVTPSDNGVRVSPGGKGNTNSPTIATTSSLMESGGFAFSERPDDEVYRSTDRDDPGIDLWDSVLRNVVAEIESVLMQYPEVEEAYFQEGGAGHAVLGLLTKALDPDRRFLLIDEIAEISRTFFGAAGAVEVYDDLESTTSSSWELFNALTPFYSRQSLREAITVEKQFSSAKDSSTDTAGFAATVRRQGARLLGAIIGRSDDS